MQALFVEITELCIISNVLNEMYAYFYWIYSVYSVFEIELTHSEEFVILNDAIERFFFFFIKIA